MLIVSTALLAFAFTFFAVSIFRHSYRLLNSRAGDYIATIKDLDAALTQETERRQIYERALNLPSWEPDRTEQIWAMAQQGDELAEAILAEELSGAISIREGDEYLDHNGSISRPGSAENRNSS